MIPVKLSIRNFMCYRGNPPTIDFTSIHVACLSGDNGSGKSALIDAMTWALWGEARSKGDDDLIHAAETEMAVEFDFAVGGQIYRIIRKRVRPKKRGGAGQSVLELQIANGSGFRAISGNSITQTQEKIKEVLHMDYDTFINSAYLRQGHADEFTRQAPAKRKEVLGIILGLADYDKLEERARELAKQQEMEKSQLENTVRDMGGELAQKPAYEAELEKVQAELSRIEATAREKESVLNELRQKKELLDSKKAQLDEMETRLRNAVKDLERWEHQVKQHHARLEEYEGLIGKRENIEAGYARFTGLKKINDDLDQKFRQSVRLEKTRNQLEARVNDAGHQLNREHAVVQHEISNLETSVQKLPGLNHQLSQVQVQIHQLSEPEASLRQKEQENQQLQAHINHFESENKRLEREIKELAEKIDLISAHTEAKCPLCETELTIEGLKLIESKYTREKQEKSDLLKSQREELAQMQTRFEEAQRATTKQESALNQEKTKAQGQLSILIKEIAETEADAKKLAALKKTLEDIEQRLAKRDFALAEQEALAAIAAELTGLGYDSEKHEQVRQELKQLEPYERDQRQLEEAEKLLVREKEAAATAEETAAGLRNSLRAEGEKGVFLTAELNGYVSLLTNLAQAETEYRQIAAERNRAQEALGSVKSKIQRCTEMEVKKREKEEKLSQAIKEVNIYRELAKAFGKTGGIQTLLIEQAIPEIENEANRLLGRLTDGRMNVKFDTQRDTKKGTVQETLDINIDDGMGTRNYEMFSGGEAFRIDFAIRIALSKLLARRAGAPLPTLIIDEGFGTQDMAGIEKLKEAINSIQDDFKMILVITHVEELRDAFPTRIDVIKTADGSTITIN